MRQLHKRGLEIPFFSKSVANYICYGQLLKEGIYHQL